MSASCNVLDEIGIASGPGVLLAVRADMCARVPRRSSIGCLGMLVQTMLSERHCFRGAWPELRIQQSLLTCTILDKSSRTALMKIRPQTEASSKAGT